MDEKRDVDATEKPEEPEVEELQIEEQVEELPDDEGNIYAEQRRLYEAGEVDSPYFEDDCATGEGAGEPVEEPGNEEPEPTPTWSRPHAFVERQRTWKELTYIGARLVLEGIVFAVTKADEKKVTAEAITMQDEFGAYWTDCVRAGQICHAIEGHWGEIISVNKNTLLITIEPASPPETPKYMQATLKLQELRAEMGAGEPNEEAEVEALDEEPIDQADPELTEEEEDLQDEEAVLAAREDAEPLIDLDDYLADRGEEGA